MRITQATAFAAPRIGVRYALTFREVSHTIVILSHAVNGYFYRRERPESHAEDPSGVIRAVDLSWNVATLEIHMVSGIVRG